MGKQTKFSGKRKKNFFKPTTKKKRKLAKEAEPINKKAIFNRYKNKQKVEEEVAKKRLLEKKLQQRQPTYSESEEEDDIFGQLVSDFGNKKQKVADSDESDGEESVDNASGEESMSDSSSSSRDNEINREEDEEDNDDIVDEENNDEAESDMNDEIHLTTLDNGDLANVVPEDPFTKHLQYDLADELLISLSSQPQQVEQVNKTWPILCNLSITIPKPVQTMTKVKPKITILEDKTFAEPGNVPQTFNKVNFNDLFIKSQIHGNIVSANKTNLIKRDLELTEIFTPLQKELFSIVNNYQDLLYAERTFSNADEIRYIYCLHIVNHMLKTRTKILHHNAKIAKKADVSDEYRDQGLVRPKVLVIVPFKDAAYRIVKTIMEILVPKEAGQVVNKNRFEEDFTGGEIAMPKKNPKPEDYELLFSGNTDDTFRFGMTLTKKTLKLYTDFYSSDIIVASPLGLRMIIGAEGEEDRDYDFLASIEVLILDQADVFLMQNWNHVLHVFEHLHLQPKKAHGTDFSRVRSWAANGWSNNYRQTLIFSSVLLPEIKSVINKKCQNYAGKVLILNPVDVGSIQQVIMQVPQMFHRFNAPNPVAAVDARFDYFIKEILPKQRDALMSHTLIYVPSYFDYARLRNHFKREDISFVQICEYSKDAKIARARDMFFHTEAHFMLYSERVHFFRRFRVKGIRHIIFYQPPTYPHFYSEMCNLMQEMNQNKYGGSECNMTVTVLYCKYDAQQVASVLGNRRVGKMLSADKNVHMFMTGD